jgi:putative transposase
VRVLWGIMSPERTLIMKKYRPEQIVEKLRQADVELGKGLGVKEVCRAIEVSEQTYYRWRQKYGGM